jgi:type IV pilus assembly protein PilC
MAKAAAIKESNFRWEGTDRKGTRIKGQTMGVSESLIKQQLRKQGITPISVRKASSLFSARKKKKIKGGDIAIFSRQIATMMQSGVPLVQALQIIGNGHENPNMTEMVFGLKSKIEGGSSFAESLRTFPLLFDDLYVNLVEAGEKSGTLDAILNKIATYKEKTESLKKKIKKALFYPSAVVAVAFIVTGVLLYFVVPQFESLFKGFGADLPAFTQMVIDMSRFVQDDWPYILIIGVGSIVGTGAAYKRSYAMRRFLDRTLIKLPAIGDIMYKGAVARFARTLSTMFGAGVPLVDALDSVAKAAGNIIFTEAIYKIRDQVATGMQLQLAMSQTGLFPSMAVQMIAIGEEAGSLDSMCAKVADFYEEEVDNLVDALSSLLEPMIMVILGVVVGGMVVAMYLPIFKLGQVI